MGEDMKLHKQVQKQDEQYANPRQLLANEQVSFAVECNRTLHLEKATFSLKTKRDAPDGSKGAYVEVEDSKFCESCVKS